MADADIDIFKVSILGKESIHCGFHLIPHIAHTVLTTLPSSTFVLITDTNVAKYHLNAFKEEFETAINTIVTKFGTSSRFLNLVIPPGETSKSRQGKAQIEDFLLLHRCTRDTVILALGGGVVGDLVGFAASTFMRGVRFIQIPTTLLAMVDSSVGGKTAIDTPQGKNLIGAFWQPEYIFIDAAFLETLPAREFSNGMAEVVKTAAIWNETEFVSLESRSAEIFDAIQTPSQKFAGRTKATRSTSQSLLLSVIVGSISVKAHIVTIDERETGLRNLVNFGHTIGHAIEAILTPSILHGECVSVGMILEAEISRHLGILTQVGVGRLTRTLKGYNLPVTLADSRIASLPASRLLTVNRLLDIMRIDKKNSGLEKKIVILQRIGATYEQKATAVSDSVIAKTLSEAVTLIPGVPRYSPVKMSTPGSKSISNRALVLAALGKGTCRLNNLLHSDDTQVMMAALVELKGARFAWEDSGETLVVDGGEGSLTAPEKGREIYLGNAGTAARFLTTVCTLVQTHPEDDTDFIVITGNARMKQRPIGPLVTALNANGSDIQFLESEGCLPLAIKLNGLMGSKIKLAASVSSQYVSSILLCAPYAVQPVSLELIGGQVISQPYIDMTIAMMKVFGVEVTRRRDPATGKLLDIYDIPKGTYINPSEYSIESDASSATYPLAIAAITGTSCTIQNIGSASLQGDARFAIEVLERMGCAVLQTPTETTVQGPPLGRLRSIEVDMEVMTDAFLTATVLAAVADGKTRIVGIANQRVKECNRIRAMMDQLAKFGVDTVELDDGLEIIGRSIRELKKGISVHCYDDHRVAMSFSVLSTVIDGTIIEEKRCVEKTWPSWWDDLENKIGIPMEGVDLVGLNSSSSSSEVKQQVLLGSVILIGMRGSGKTYIGQMAASALGWTCIDADKYFEEKVGQGVREFVQQKGWLAFRETETTVLKELLREKPQKHVISLGGGVVEVLESRNALKSYGATTGPVVYISRQIDDMVVYLNAETARPAYDEPIVDVYRRREPWFRECSMYEFVNLVQNNEFKNVVSKPKPTEDEVARFFNHITGQKPNLAANLGPGKRSYFLSLTYSDITQASSNIDNLIEGVDALELRVDLLRSCKDNDHVGYSIPSLSFVSTQVAALRRMTSMPIVYTVRTQSQGGAFPDGATGQIHELLNHALRVGVEYLDVEITLPDNVTGDLVAKKGNSKIIASWHDWSGNMAWDGSFIMQKYEIANRFGDIIKIVGKANTMQDNFTLENFVSKVNAAPNPKPIIAINMGYEGQLSRALNRIFSPVSHALLSTKAAPGQLTFKQIQQSLHLIGLLPPKRFYLFGNPITHSMSPTLHNAGFETLGLPHHYNSLQTTTIGNEIKAAIAAPDFGGASVTIPFKLDVIPLLDKLTPAAEAIGAVNTIIPHLTMTPDCCPPMLIGDNTDWLGIKVCILSKISSAPIYAALVIGGGGTARAAIYALQALGACTIYLYNRTYRKAVTLAEAFPDAHMCVVSQIAHWPYDIAPSVIVSSVPAAATTVTDDEHALQLTPALFSYRDGPAVVVDMAYKPAETPLLRLAAATAGGNWERVHGLEVLLEQGYVQFEAWTGRRCPRSTVAKVVRQVYDNQS